MRSPPNRDWDAVDRDDESRGRERPGEHDRPPGYPNAQGDRMRFGRGGSESPHERDRDYERRGDDRDRDRETNEWAYAGYGARPREPYRGGPSRPWTGPRDEEREGLRGSEETRWTRSAAPYDAGPRWGREQEHRPRDGGMPGGRMGDGPGTSRESFVTRALSEQNQEGQGEGWLRRTVSSSGGFRGKGPRNYNRSDERIREDVCERLMEDDHVDATDVTVTVKDGEVSLSGTVSSRMVKRIAEDLAAAVSGVKDVHNSLKVGASRASFSEDPQIEEHSDRHKNRKN